MNEKIIATLEKHGLALCRRAHRMYCGNTRIIDICLDLRVEYTTALSLVVAGRTVALIESGCI